MTSSITRYAYRPDAHPQLQQLSADDNQRERKNQDKQLKNRAHETPFPAKLASSRLQRRHATSSGEQSFQLSQDTPIKGVGFSTSSNGTASTGTSKPGVLCVTDGMELCVAVAVGGESQTKGKGKARVFHVMPENRMAQWEIKDYIQKLKKDGYTAKVAIHGGDNTSDASMKKIMAINTVLQQLSVPVEFSAVGDGCKANGNGPLGAVVEEDGSVRFVTKLVT